MCIAVKVFAPVAILMLYCLVCSYPVFNEEHNDLHENNQSKVIQTNAEEGDFFEGDIILMPWQKQKFYPDLRPEKNLKADPSALWPNKTVYYIFSSHEFSRTQRRRVRDALKDLMRETCVKFLQRTNQYTYLRLRNAARGCASAVGYHNVGPLDLYLGGRSCQTRGTIQHEFLHALGFWHEHTRPDRDNHVTIVWDNISPGKEYNFLKRTPAETIYLNMPYDYGSVMHYRSIAFSKDGKSKTIIPHNRAALKQMGQRIRFTKVDIAKLNRLYNCPLNYYRGDDVANKLSVTADVSNNALDANNDLTETSESELTENTISDSQELDRFEIEELLSGNNSEKSNSTEELSQAGVTQSYVTTTNNLQETVKSTTYISETAVNR